MTLIDTNVWIDLIEQDPKWSEWSLAQIRRAKAQGMLAINPIIYAELVPVYDTQDALLNFTKLSGVTYMPISADCAYLAARAFEAYRLRGGRKSNVLADFFIGAQAQSEGWTLLTRDAARYKTYFPKIKLIAPEK
jgi:predicted nucleic acid-binding protein